MIKHFYYIFLLERWEINSDGDGDEYDEERFFKLFKKGNVKKKRKGRQCQWKESFVDDLVNIIVENEKYRQLLITNVKNAKNGQSWKVLEKRSKKDAQNVVKSFHIKGYLH